MGLLMCPGTPLIAGEGPANVPVNSLSLGGVYQQRLLQENHPNRI